MSINKTWNRSSAWSPEVLARLIAATNRAIKNAIETADKETFTDEQRAEAIQLLCDGVTDGLAQFAESLQPHHVEVENILQSK